MPGIKAYTWYLNFIKPLFRLQINPSHSINGFYSRLPLPSLHPTPDTRHPVPILIRLWLTRLNTAVSQVLLPQRSEEALHFLDDATLRCCLSAADS